MAGVKKSYTFHRLLFGVSFGVRILLTLRVHLFVGGVCLYSSVGEVNSVVKVGVVMLIQGEARGFTEVGSSPTALLAHLYSLLRSNKQHRRAFLRALLRYFEDYEVQR